MNNIQKINQEEALNLSKFFINNGQNFFLFGRRGTGKTEIILQAIKQTKYKVNYINLSVLERSDLAGYPNLNSNSDNIQFKLPYFLEKANGKPDTILLFDELDKASPEITAPLLEILQYKTVNGTPLNIVSCVLTGNLVNENSYSNEISAALLDRGAKFILDFDFNNWFDWAINNNINDLITGFLKTNQEFAVGKLEDDIISPSPRAWVNASKAIGNAKKLKINDISTISQIISGFVGNEAGLRFKLWFEYYKQFDPFINSLIDNNHLDLDFSKLNKTEQLIFVISCCYVAKQKVILYKDNVYLENLCNFFINSNVDKEMQMLGINNSFSFDLIAKHKLYKCNVFFNICKEINEKISKK